MEHVLSMIGLAKKAGYVEIGEEPVESAARAKKARLIFYAEDAGMTSQKRANSYATLGNCLILPLPCSKEDLGASVGRGNCAMLAITDIGFAEALAKKLVAIDEKKYGEAAQALAIKAKRAKERKSAQIQHDRKLKKTKN